MRYFHYTWMNEKHGKDINWSTLALHINYITIVMYEFGYDGNDREIDDVNMVEINAVNNWIDGA